MRRLLGGLAVVATLVLTACSGGGASTPGGSGGTSANAANATPANATRTNAVDLPPSYVFSPQAIEIKAGSTVTWTNHDNFSHSVQVQGQPQGVDASVHMLSPGQATQITFATPGTYSYLCTLHSQNMRGTVVVDAA